MNDELTGFDETIKERPVFLKTLCILTFIFSAFTILSNIVSIVNPQKAANIITDSRKKINDSLNNPKVNKRDNGANFSRKMAFTLSGFSPEKIRMNATGAVVSSLLCLFGALLMWRLKKAGYFIYILGTITGIIVPFLLFGNNFIGVFMTAWAVFFGVLFIIFYGMNYKSMNN